MWGSQARKALEMARSVDARVNAHEARCTERWNEARAVWDRVEKAVESLRTGQATQATTVAANKASWMGPTIAAMGALVMLLLTSVGALAFHIITTGH